MFIIFTLMITSLFVPHLFLNRNNAREYLSKWKPQIIAGNISSTTGVQQYTTSAIALQDPLCSGALIALSPEICMFVVSIDQNVTIVKASIYSMSSDSSLSMSNLRDWFELVTSDDSVLINGQLNDP